MVVLGIWFSWFIVCCSWFFMFNILFSNELFTFAGMKTTLTLEAEKPEQLKLLLDVARQMGIVVAFEDEEDAAAAKDFLKASFKNMEEEWLAPENDHWDEFFKNAPKMK
jgi:hypothetical protein